MEEREREIRELRRRRSEQQDDEDEALRQAEERNRELEDEIENVRGLLEDNMDEIDRLKEKLKAKCVPDSALRSSTHVTPAPAPRGARFNQNMMH